MGGDFNKTDTNVEKDRDSCQHPQSPNLSKYLEGRRYNIIKDRDFYLNQSERFWTSRHNGFFSALQSTIQQSSATGYTQFSVLLPKVAFKSQTNFQYEVENLYHFLKSFLQKRGISFSWEPNGEYFPAWKGNLDAIYRRSTQSYKGAGWAIDHHSYPIVWFGKKSQICEFAVARIDWSMDNGI